jgi:hypothetical protein
MWSHECLREVATEQAAEGLAVRVVSGGASLADAERGIDEVAYAYAAEKDALPKTPTALLGWLSNRIGWEARERKSMPGRRDVRPAFRHTGPAGPNPAVAPFAPLPPDARPWTPED